MTIKSIDYLGRAAFEAYKKKRVPEQYQIDTEGWDELDDAARDAWRAVATQLVAELATLH